MIDRAEKTGFGVALVGHAALLAVLTLGLATVGRVPPPSDAIEVSFVDDIGLVSAASRPAEAPPEPGMATETGPIEDAAVAEPEPAPPMPRARPEPRPSEAAPPAPRRERSAPSRSESGTRERNRRSRLGPDLLKGIGRDPSSSRSREAPAATMSTQAMMDIGSAIQRQVQPCADRQVYPGRGAERIVTAINLKLNRDGSLAARPRVVRQTGIDDGNSRYADRVADLAIAAFVGCAPLRGLPQELYDVPRGWSSFTLNYRLPG